MMLKSGILNLIIVLSILVQTQGEPLSRPGGLKSLNNIPIQWCQLDEGGYCVFNNVQTTKEQPRFQPAAENISTIKKVKFLNSIIPIVTDDICNGFPALEVLYLDNSNIEEIHEDAFKNCKNILQFLFRSNKIKHISKDTFRHTTTLQGIHLDSNQIEELDLSVFSSLKSVLFFELANNRLKSFPVEIVKDNPVLQELYLGGNDLSDIDYDELINSVPTLKIIGYNDNELSCKKVATMNAVFASKGIERYKSNYGRLRYYPQDKVDDVICAPDISWTAAYYRKVKEYEIDSNCPAFKRLEERIENIENLLKDVLEVFKK